jgi:four helix bundle protein
MRCIPTKRDTLTARVEGPRHPNISKGWKELGNSFRDLIVWRRAIQLSTSIYRLTADFPKEEIYGLTSQLRRAGVSVASNIAEGYGRASSREYKQFLAMARGSNLEVQTQLTIPGELGFAAVSELHATEELSHEVGKMLRAIITKLSA